MQSKSRYSYSRNRAQDEQRRRRRIRNWIILLLLVTIAVVALRLLNSMGKTTEITATQLPCYSDQDVTAFGDSVLYYDGASIQCCSTTGAYRWSVPVGSNASFSVSDSNVIVWAGAQIYIINSSGRTTYNEAMTSTVQFARIGTNYAAVVIGDDTNPDLLVKDLQGSQVDEESEGFSGMLLLDVGFYGDSGQYMWTLALDVYSTAINTVMNTFEVGKMNTGEVSLGENLAYKVIFENSRLRVFTTQLMYTFDYKAVQDTNSSKLVYGWKVIDSLIPSRGDASILLAPTSQSGSSQSITNLRILIGTDTDNRFNLPETCIGAFLKDSSIYALSGDTLYRSSSTVQRFYPYTLPLPEGVQATSYIGLTGDGYMLIAADSSVYAVSMPE